MEQMDFPKSYEKMRPIVEHEFFDHRAVTQLEEYVEEQVKSSTYDFEANKALLKLYSFFPDMTNVDMVNKVATKALMNMPGTDMCALEYLLPDEITSVEPMASLVKAHETLETGVYDQFWMLCNNSESELYKLIESVPGFRQHARRFILTSLSNAFQTLPQQMLEASMDLKGAKLEAFWADTDVVEELAGGVCRFKRNSYNQRQPKKFKESIEFNTVLEVVNKIQA